MLPIRHVMDLFSDWWLDHARHPVYMWRLCRSQRKAS